MLSLIQQLQVKSPFFLSCQHLKNNSDLSSNQYEKKVELIFSAYVTRKKSLFKLGSPFFILEMVAYFVNQLLFLQIVKQKLIQLLYIMTI